MPGVMEKEAKQSGVKRLWEATLDDTPMSIGWSASGKWVAAASGNGSIHVFDAALGTEVRVWQGHRMGATVIAWHPWDDVFASGGQDGTAKLWSPKQDEPLATLACGSAWVEHLGWAPSGKLLATACGRNLKTWSKEGELLCAFDDQPNTIAGLDWSTDSQRLVSACYGQVVFWTPRESAPRKTFLWKGSMVAMAWSPDGRYLSHGNQDATVHFWIVATGRELQMTGYPSKVAQLCWDRKSRYLATGGSPHITVWDCSGKGPRDTTPLTLMQHIMPLRSLRFQQEGPYLASGCARGDVAVWLVGRSKSPLAVSTLKSPITDLAWCPNKKLLAAAAESGKIVAFAMDGF